MTSRYADEVTLMSPPGVIKGIGKPSEVITEESVSETYRIGYRIVEDCGRPHVIPGDPLDSEIKDV